MSEAAVVAKRDVDIDGCFWVVVVPPATAANGRPTTFSGSMDCDEPEVGNACTNVPPDPSTRYAGATERAIHNDPVPRLLTNGCRSRPIFWARYPDRAEELPTWGDHMATAIRPSLRVAVTALLAAGGAAVACGAGATPSSPSAEASDRASVGVGGGDTDLREPQTSADGVEVSTYGTAWVTPDMNSTLDPVVQAVHAVQRVGDRTVVYWSFGFQGERFGAGYSGNGRSPTDVRSLQGVYAAQYVNVAVPERGVLLYAVPDPEQTNGASGSSQFAIPKEPGVMAVQYTVLAGLPADVSTVDVTLGYAGIVTDVPVGEGLLEPLADGPVIPLGTGWPEVDDRFLRPVENLVPSVRPLLTLTEQLDGASRESEVAEEVTIDIAADVLFAFNSADLTAGARQRVTEVATEVAGRAAPGVVTVVGHTDSEGGDTYNDDLSRRRAQAVADVLGPVLAPAGITLAVEGRGEREPVAENGSAEGRQLNRRVSVGFTQEQGS